ncbi:unnamed protein product [Mycena citricolor]|uniref:RNA-dependent RNA polymerase n=1 Tax=Mycena citricolor TaxID=2018698 RepID=A0AAD2Q6Y6_9AGAR|nr:unnamed protein product [Mycena citricolor]
MPSNASRSSLGSNFDDDFELDEDGWNILQELEANASQASSSASPTRTRFSAEAWRLRSPRVDNTPATPSTNRRAAALQDRTPATLSPAVRQSASGVSRALAQSLDTASLQDDGYAVSPHTPLAPLRLFSRDRPQMPPPSHIPERHSLQPTSTQSSLQTDASGDSFFADSRSRTSSMSSADHSSSSQSSPRKRAAGESALFGGSPSKARQLSPDTNLRCGPPEPLFSLTSLFEGKHGYELPALIIAHDTTAQKMFDEIGVPLGAQWELARGVVARKWSWKKVVDKLKQHRTLFLTGDANASIKIAPNVVNIMLGRDAKVVSAKELRMWAEVDRESYIRGKVLDGPALGALDGPKENYYGGQIRYGVRLRGKEGKYKLRLEKPTKGRSFRFARVLGSASVLHVSLPDKLVQNEPEQLAAFFSQRFILNGRVFIAIPPKDTNSIYLIETEQGWERSSLKYFGDQRRVSFDSFLKTHNPPALNSNQPFAKYIARFALGLSTSTPVLEFQEASIHFIDDVISSTWKGTGKVPAEQTMTDGCGFINQAGFRIIAARLDYPTPPTAVQGRIGGSKGLWTLHPSNADAEPKIWIRASQRKIRLEGSRREHRIFDLLRASHPPASETRESLSEQSILCLSHNGVPDEVFVKLMLDGLAGSVEPLLDWTPGSRAALWRAVEKSGNVSNSRLQRFAGSQSRVLGLRGRDPEESVENDETGESSLAVEDDDEKDDYDDDNPRSLAEDGRDLAGGPLSLHERTVELIQAGFSPREDEYLNTKLRWIVKNEIAAVVDRCRISLPASTAADGFVIPDPLDVLREGEIYFRASNGMVNAETQECIQTLTGRVIIMTEVYTVIFTWLQSLLDHFRNSPLAAAPPDLDDCFERNVKSVTALETELAFMDPVAAQREFQRHLLTGLKATQVGLYSFFHENAIYKHGYDHPEAILMAHIGNTLLDAGKTGLTLKDEVFQAHRSRHGERIRLSGWKVHGRADGDRFLLRKLMDEGRAMGDELLRKFDIDCGRLTGDSYQAFSKDPALLLPWKNALAKAEKANKTCAPWAQSYAEDLDFLKKRVDQAHDKFRQIKAAGDQYGTNNQPNRQTVLLEAQALFQHDEDPDDVELRLIDSRQRKILKASYAYSRQTGFGFDMAFRELCQIKAESTTGGNAPVSRLFDEVKSVSRAAARATKDGDCSIDELWS